MTELLLSLRGRIGRNRFWQGLVILTVASVIVVAGRQMVSPLFDYVGFLLIFPYICVYGKRLHDGGHSAWWVIAIYFGTQFVQFLTLLILIMFFTSQETVAALTELSERFWAGDTEGFEEGARYISRQFLPFFLITTVAGNAAIGFLVGRLRATPGDNRYGPPN